VFALLFGGVALLIIFLVHETRVSRPWAHVSVLFDRNIGLALLAILLYTLASLANSILVPNFLGLHLRPEQTGELLCTYGALPMFILMPLSVYLLKYFEARAIVILGLSAFAAAGLWGTDLTHDWARGDFVGIVILLSVGQVFTFLPLILVTVSNSDPTRATAFSAYIQISRLGGAEIGAALMGTWLRVREQVHSNLLGRHIENGGADVTHILERLTQELASRGASLAPARALGMLAARVQREANVLAYIDGFSLCFWLAIFGLLLVSLMTRSPPGPFTPKPFGMAEALGQGRRRMF
jgi:MFS transporter, DHA2 family, multidrug resistance protein